MAVVDRISRDYEADQAIAARFDSPRNLHVIRPQECMPPGNEIGEPPTLHPDDPGPDMTDATGQQDTSDGRRDADGQPRQAAPRIILFRPIHEVIATPTQVRWLLRGVIEERVITLVAGKRGSYKSFLVLHWLMTLACRGVPVFLVSAEGAGLARRVEAWLKVHAPAVDPISLPLYVHEQRVNFNDPVSLVAVRAAIEDSGMEPELLAIDTFSKNSGALDENSNSDVKAFIGGLDLGLRTPLNLSILLVAHTGHGDQGASEEPQPSRPTPTPP